MVGALIAVRMLLGGWFTGGVARRMVGVGAIVGTGLAVYFPAAWLLGGMDKEALKALVRRKKAV
jgi:putative peptidoglycan lipid II flippase